MEHRGYYLEKVYFILTCGEVFVPFEESIRELQKAGISVDIFAVRVRFSHFAKETVFFCQPEAEVMICVDDAKH